MYMQIICFILHVNLICLIILVHVVEELSGSTDVGTAWQAQQETGTTENDDQDEAEPSDTRELVGDPCDHCLHQRELHRTNGNDGEEGERYDFYSDNSV